MIPTEHFLVLGAVLFCIGLAIVITKKNAIVVLIGIELMLNAANVNLIAFSQNDNNLEGQIFSIFIIVVAAAEMAIALAIIFKIYQYYQSTELDKLDELKD